MVGLDPGPRIYEDTGCAAAPSCLSCPLPKCVHDVDAREAEKMLRLERDRQKVRTIVERGWTAEQAAQQLGITQRTVFRMLQRVREAEVLP